MSRPNPPLLPVTRIVCADCAISLPSEGPIILRRVWLDSLELFPLHGADS